MSYENARLFLEEFIGKPAENFAVLPQSGSSRQNFVARVSGEKYIVTANNHIAENESFFYFSKIFSGLNLNTPQIFAISANRQLYIQEFVGGKTLSEIIEEEELTKRTRALVKQTLEQLFQLQHKTRDIDYSKTFEYSNYDELPITNDLFYFKSFIADVLEIPYHKAKLLLEFKKLTARISVAKPRGLMLRDFQPRNVVVNEDDQVFFIDYQAAMEGPLLYDVVSFLFQAKANFPQDFKDEMLQYYFSLWRDGKTQTALRESLQPIQLIRFLQVLGAYGFRGLVQKKEHFRASMSQGIENLYHFSQNWAEMKDYPELQKLIAQLKTEQIHTKLEAYF